MKSGKLMFLINQTNQEWYHTVSATWCGRRNSITDLL